MMLVYVGVILVAKIICTHAVSHTKTTSEGHYFSIDCPADQSILVLNAVFGGTRRDGPVVVECRSTSGRAALATSKLCNGYNACMFHVTSALFGQSCANYKRFLRVEYTCIHQTPSIHCGINEVLVPCRHVCPRMCPESNLTMPEGCIKICIGPGCACRDRCVRDRKSMICVAEEYCSTPGDSNDVFTLCHADQQRWCPGGFLVNDSTLLPPKTCTPGYVCKKGYLRDPFTHKCVAPRNCPIID